ncbi:glycosyltransferase [Sulfurimonas sp. HSL-3221]|uniref:glycosyltransferase n=1 Tax=Sulfurimonadaceae TaxID=2771471 RepID=UPI001E59FC7D|nr:glycosyltransferase [Sulfurimonas sp. HSL-3221]UFS61683.1 glycosyltransferase [Sulfurimonas sp. HSL-3221]
MKKLLYITDQQEYADHGTIAPLFGHYLKKYLQVSIVYYTRYKDSFQYKGDDCIVPEEKLHSIIGYLDEEGVDVGSFDFILVRNRFDILRRVLAHRARYGYRVGFRLSFPKNETAYAAMMAKYKRALLPSLALKYKRSRERKLIEACDLFLPSSAMLASGLYPALALPTFPLPAGIDPARVAGPKNGAAAPRRFIYVGSLDPLRRFETLLDAFAALTHLEWSLDISTFDPTYLKTILKEYPMLSGRFRILQAANLSELGRQIGACDVGLAMMPALPIFAMTLPAKVMDYYAAGVPALLTDTPKNRDRLRDGDEAFFCAFDAAAIAAKLETLIRSDAAHLALVREQGLERLLGAGRSYDVMAEQLYRRLTAL